FIARGLQLLRLTGQMCFIVSDTWRTIRSHRPLRRKLLETTSVTHVIDLPYWIFQATVNTCILTLKNSASTDSHTLIAADLRGIERGDWGLLAENLKAIAEHGIDLQTTSYARYTFPQKLIESYANVPFFIGPPNLYRLMCDERFARLHDIADVKVGLQT